MPNVCELLTDTSTAWMCLMKMIKLQIGLCFVEIIVCKFYPALFSNNSTVLTTKL